MTKNINK